MLDLKVVILCLVNTRLHSLIVRKMLAFMLMDVEVMMKTGLLYWIKFKSMIMIKLLIGLLESLNVMLRVLMEPLFVPMRVWR